MQIQRFGALTVGLGVGILVGEAVGATVGTTVGTAVGEGVGAAEGTAVGCAWRQKKRNHMFVIVPLRFLSSAHRRYCSRKLRWALCRCWCWSHSGNHSTNICRTIQPRVNERRK